MPSRIVFFFGLCMAVLYIGCGVFMFFTQRVIVGMPSNYQKILGGGFVLYGAFRLFRYFKNYKQSTDVEQD